MIFELLPEGAENAMPLDVLMSLTGCKNVRELRKQINRERCEGNLILSRKDAGGGYYRPADVAEVARFVRLYQREAASITAMLKAAKAAIRGANGGAKDV